MFQQFNEIYLIEEDAQVFLGDNLKAEAVCYPSLPFPTLKGTRCLFMCAKNHYTLAVKTDLMRQEKLSEVFKELQIGG